MSDLIKRSDAINSIYKLKKTVIKHNVLNYHDGLFDALEIVQNLPSADRPRGEWIDISEWYTPKQKCSICEMVVDGYGSNFCPNCGADMRKETVDYKSIILICDEEGNWSMHGERKENE